MKPGERIEIRPLPGDRIEVRAAAPKGSIDGFIGLLAGRTGGPGAAAGRNNRRRSANALRIRLGVAQRLWPENCRDRVGASGPAGSQERCAQPVPAVEAGLTMLEADGDFADGVIAHEGHWLGGEVFVSFDQGAINVLRQQGRDFLSGHGDASMNRSNNLYNHEILLRQAEWQEVKHDRSSREP